MQGYKEFFKDKKITIMGLGLLGRGLGYTKFLAECGARLTVTDLKTKEELKTSLDQLKDYDINYILGEHKLEDFKNKDMIIKAAGVPLNSIYIKEAEKNNIPIEMDVSLFMKLAPSVTLVGVTGTRGKSMTTTLIYEILKQNLTDSNVYLGGNIRGVATLPLLEKIDLESGKDDILVAELDSWQLQGFGENKISPHISIFTSFMPDHMNYYKDDMKKYFSDKANIFKYQSNEDYLIIRPEMQEYIFTKDTVSELIIVDVEEVKDFDFKIPGKYHRENMACAVEVGKIFNISIEDIKKTIENFEGLEGRLQHLKTFKGVKIYNDNNATIPEATVFGIEALKKEGDLILICGGSDKGLDLEDLVSQINKSVKKLILLPGTGTEKLASFEFKVESYKVESLKDAVNEVLKSAKKGDIILFSPAFASFGAYQNEYERNDEFIKIVKNLK